MSLPAEEIRTESEPSTEVFNWNYDQINTCLRKIRTIWGQKYPTSEIISPVSPDLANALMELIGDYDLLSSAKCASTRVREQLQFLISNGGQQLFSTDEKENEIIGDIKPSDFEDLLKYKPTEALGDMTVFIYTLLITGEKEQAASQLRNLGEIRAKILAHSQLTEVYIFIEKLFESLINWLSGEEIYLITTSVDTPSDSGNVITIKVENLSLFSRQALKVVQSCVLRHYRHDGNKRIELLKEVVHNSPSMAEWITRLVDAMRRKRRDVPKYARGKVPTEEEFELLDKAVQLDPENPFVKFTVLDEIIDCLRGDIKIGFTIGDRIFKNNSDTVAYMKSTCREILKKFPCSIKFYSQVSDYFARFVSLFFFDVPFAEECLEEAYGLNPEYPPTVHRLGIFNRMSKGSLSQSFEWFQKAASLDPSHVNSFTECVKNMLGYPDKYNVARFIGDKLMSNDACSWSDSDVLDILFYKGISHFMRNEFNEMLESWKLIMSNNEQVFRLCDLDQTGGFYNWDENQISTDKLRVWMYQNKDNSNMEPSLLKIITRLYNLMVGFDEPMKSHFTINHLQCSKILKQFRSITLE